MHSFPSDVVLDDNIAHTPGWMYCAERDKTEHPQFICCRLLLKWSGCSPYLATTTYIGHASTGMNNVVPKILKAGEHSCVIISVVAMWIPFQKSCVPCYPLHSAYTSTMSANLKLVCVNEQAGDSLSDSHPPLPNSTIPFYIFTHTSVKSLDYSSPETVAKGTQKILVGVTLAFILFYKITYL